jgi:lysophospholipase L1-like esterase
MGYIYLSMRVSPDGIFSRFKKDKGGYVILCLGDSFTLGGNVQVKETYPFYLKRILDLNHPDKKIKVINRGICEYNSAQVLRILPKELSYYSPDFVILLVGASNEFNFIGFFNKEKTLYSQLKDMIYNLRIYKMIKMIALNLNKKIFLQRLKSDVNLRNYKLIDKDWLIDLINPNYHIFEEIANMNSDLVSYFEQIGEDKRASDLFKRFLEIDPNSDLLVYQISNYVERYFHKSKHNLESNFMDFLDRIKNAPEPKDNRLSRERFRFFKSLQETYNKEKIDSRLREDIEEIVNVCLKNNVKIIIQNYPFPYPMADKALRDIAVNYSLLFVDNGKSFAELKTKRKIDEYFQDDTHCTPLGYQTMAENIYKLIQSENIFKIEEK